MTEALSDSHRPIHDDQILSGNVHPTVHHMYEFEAPPPAFHNTYPYGSTIISGNVEPGHVPDGTFENTWMPPLEPGGVWSEFGVVTGEETPVPLEQSDYAPKRSEDLEPVPQRPESQAVVNEAPIETGAVAAPEREAKELTHADLSAVEEMMATVIKIQEAAKPKTQKSLKQEFLAPEEPLQLRKKHPRRSSHVKQ